MDTLTLYLLLDTIKNKKNLKALLRSGVSYKGIADFSEEAMRENLIITSHSEITLTKQGEDRLRELAITQKKRDKSKWIDKDFTSQIEKLDPGVIYLPYPNELTF